MYKKFFSKFKMPKLIIVPLFLILLLPMAISAQTSELSLVDIFTALRSKKATLQQKNQLLTAGVKQRGVTFSLSKSLQEELQNAGANEELIEAIRLKSPVKVSDPKPTVDASPEPVDTKPVRNFEYYQNKGNSSFVIGDFEKAITHYSEAIKLNDKETSLYLSRGLAFYREKQFTPAIADFDKFIELNPDESTVYFNRGNALKEVGKFERALADYKKAGELDEENEEAKSAFAKLDADLKPKQVTISTPTNTTPTITVPVKPEKSTPNADLNNSDTFVNVGSMEGLIVKLLSPKYPAQVRSAGIGGIVTVRIILDEKGKVLSAKAIDGPKGLFRHSEIAAKRSKFKPYKVDDIGIKATGIIKYNFEANND